MQGRISKIESLSAVDGPGLRFVVFMQGCPQRCAFCHNPETWDLSGGQVIESGELAEKILRTKLYLKSGGVTVSGGEPLLQARFLTEVFKKLKAEGINTALDTSGCALNADIAELLTLTDLILLDIKFTSELKYERYSAGSLEQTLLFLKELLRLDKEVIVRYVVIPGINDADIAELKSLCAPFSCVKKIELLPFSRLCLEKYDELGLEFKFKNIPECTPEAIEALNKLL